MRLHGESLSSTLGCPQVIQIPSCIVPFRTQLWPADVTTPVLKGQYSHLCLGPRKALAFRPLSHRCAWSFWVTETHEAVCPVLYLSAFGVFGHSQPNFKLIILCIVPLCVILTLPSSLLLVSVICKLIM